MLSRLPLRPFYFIALSATCSHQVATLAQDDSITSSTLLSYTRRERAARVLTIASTIEPEETAAALKLARTSIRTRPLTTVQNEDKTFLRHTLKEGVARGIASAAGGAAASYAIIKVVLLVIPLVPSPIITRTAMSLVSFGAAAVELAAFPDITTVELLMIKDSDLGCRARKTIETYNPHLLLLQTLDRQIQEQNDQYCDKVDMDDLFIDSQDTDLVTTGFQFR